MSSIDVEVTVPDQDVYRTILEMVAQVPAGWVATYPDIAEQCDCTPADVVAAIKWAKIQGLEVCDHRVVRSDGRCQSFHKELLGSETLIDYRGSVLEFEARRCRFDGEQPHPAPDPEQAALSQAPPANRAGRGSSGVNLLERAGGEGDLRKLPLLLEFLTLLAEREHSGGSWFLCNTFAGRGRFGGARFRSSLARRRPTDNPVRVIRSVESPWRLHPYFRRTLRDLDQGTPFFDGISHWLVRFACEQAARGIPVHVRLHEEDPETCATLLDVLERTFEGFSFRTTSIPDRFLLEPVAGLRIEVVQRNWTVDREEIEQLARASEQAVLLVDPPTAYTDNWKALQESPLFSVDGLWSFTFAYSRREEESPIDAESAWKWGSGPYHYYLFGPEGAPLQDAERERLAALDRSLEAAFSRLRR